MALLADAGVTSPRVRVGPSLDVNHNAQLAPGLIPIGPLEPEPIGALEPEPQFPSGCIVP